VSEKEERGENEEKCITVCNEAVMNWRMDKFHLSTVWENPKFQRCRF